jgi:hypothetical protein
VVNEGASTARSTAGGHREDDGGSKARMEVLSFNTLVS